MADPVLDELDEHIRALEADGERIRRELGTAREMRNWWAHRHTPSTPGASEPTPARVLPPDSPEDSKTVREWIIHVLSPDQRLQPAQIRDAALAAGWQTTSGHPATVIRNNLRRMREEGEVAAAGTKYFLAKASLADVEPSDGHDPFTLDDDDEPVGNGHVQEVEHAT